MSTEAAPTTRTTDQIRDAVTEIVAAELGVGPGDLTPDTDLRAVEGADSIKVLRMIAKIEQRFDIELDDADVFEVSTIEQVTGVVGKALA